MNRLIFLSKNKNRFSKSQTSYSENLMSDANSTATTQANTWLLPDGVADILPIDALVREHMRRDLLDTMTQHGYDLVEPPLVEYTESLLNCASEDLKRQTFRLVDQLTGRLMGVRADITHQVARIDAHVLPTENVARYCYAAPVLHTRPKATFASRTPMQVGAELYGHSGISADIEVIDLLMAMLEKIGIYSAEKTTGLHINLGNVAIFERLAHLANLDDATQTKLLGLYERKAMPELKEFCETLEVAEPVEAQDFYVLAQYSQNLDGLLEALSTKVRQTQTVRYAVYDLKRMQAHLQENWANVHASVDAAELSSYHYHTGVVFSLYGEYELKDVPANTVNNVIQLAQGGRYDGIGKNFGRHRFATGFSCDLSKLFAFSEELNVNTCPKDADKKRIAIPALKNEADLQELVKQAKADGHVVINKLSENDGLDATHEYMIVDKKWELVEIKRD